MRGQVSFAAFKRQRRLEEGLNMIALTEGCVYHLHRGLESLKLWCFLVETQAEYPTPTSGIKDLPCARGTLRDLSNVVKDHCSL